MNSTVSLHSEETLLAVLVQLIVIILAARAAGALFRRMGQPQVCGEIAAGLVLGPSLLGGLFPSTFEYVFKPAVAPIFGVMSQIGLVLLLFLIGLEFDFKHLRARSRAPVWISLAGITLPFGLGILLAQLLYPHVGEGIDRLGFSLFISVALCITALPVLGRIMIELGLNRTRIGAIAITAAAIDDAVGWILLALVTAIVRAESAAVGTLVMAAHTVVYALVMFFVVRPVVHRWATRSLEKSGGELSATALGILLVLVFGSAIVTNLIGIFAIFGGFTMGAILFDHAELRTAVHRRLNDFVTVFFLPIFFTYTGLRTDVDALQGATLWLLCGLVLLAATVGKLGGCTVAARLSGLNWKEAFSVGIMMNTRALMELIVINVGYDLGIIPRSVFVMLVIMAVTTTFVTAPVLRRLMPGAAAPPVFRPRIYRPEPSLDAAG